MFIDVGLNAARFLVTAVSLVGCGSSQLDAPGTRGLGAPEASTPCERNFYEDEVVCYPTSDIGIRVRDGSTPGQRIENIKLLGYEGLDPNDALSTADGVRTVPLSDFYDPESRRLKLLMIMSVVAYASACVQETSALVQGAAQALAQNGVSTLQVVEMAYGQPATPSSLLTWITTEKANFSVALSGEQLLVFEDGLPYSPFMLFVDARSMELLGTAQGFDATFAAAQTWVQWVEENPPLSWH